MNARILCLFVLSAARFLSYAGELSSEMPEMPASYYAEMAEVKFRYHLNAEALDLLGQAMQKSPAAELRTRCRVGIAFVLEAQGKPDEALKIWKEMAGD